MKASHPILTTEALVIGYAPSSSTPNVVTGPVDLQLFGGELICLLGPNGSGKSTLVRSLAGIQPVLGGSIRIGNAVLSAISPLETAKKVSIVLTDKVEAGNLSVYSLVALGRYPYTGWFGRLSKRDEEKVQWALEVTNTAIYAKRLVNTLSDGEQQKVMLARALAQDTQLIILDEPTAHLDLPNRVELFSLLRKLSQQTGKAILLSTHELDLALQAADQLWLMHPTRPIHTGVPEDMVLNGSFEATFQRDGFAFDKNTGTFKMHALPNKAVGLVGDGAAAFWTKRALERQGFRVDQSDARSEHIVIVQIGNRACWVLYQNNARKEFTSIGELLRALRNISATVKESHIPSDAMYK